MLAPHSPACPAPPGLDGRSAAVVMSVVRAVADSGRTVVCTIHQPSAAIFGRFDDLLLLQRGGCVVYNGPAAEVHAYLSQVRWRWLSMR